MTMHSDNWQVMKTCYSSCTMMPQLFQPYIFCIELYWSQYYSLLYAVHVPLSAFQISKYEGLYRYMIHACLTHNLLVDLVVDMGLNVRANVRTFFFIQDFISPVKNPDFPYFKILFKKVDWAINAQCWKIVHKCSIKKEFYDINQSGTVMNIMHIHFFRFY